MPLLHVIVILFIVGVALFAVNKYAAPIMDATILKILNIAVVVFVIVWLLSLLGIFDMAGGIWVGRRP